MALPGLLLAALIAGHSHAQPVYRCGNAYSQTPCSSAQAIGLPSLVEVPAAATAPGERPQQQPSSRHRQAMQEARDWERTERTLDKAQAAVPPRRSAQKNRSACEAASRRIEKIDALARRGGSVQKMERLREERQAARDWQFRAGCS